MGGAKSFPEEWSRKPERKPARHSPLTLGISPRFPADRLERGTVIPFLEGRVDWNFLRMSESELTMDLLMRCLREGARVQMNRPPTGRSESTHAHICRRMPQVHICGEHHALEAWQNPDDSSCSSAARLQELWLFYGHHPALLQVPTEWHRGPAPAKWACIRGEIFRLPVTPYSCPSQL